MKKKTIEGVRLQQAVWKYADDLFQLYWEETDVFMQLPTLEQKHILADSDALGEWLSGQRVPWRS